MTASVNQQTISFPHLTLPRPLVLTLTGIQENLEDVLSGNFCNSDILLCYVVLNPKKTVQGSVPFLHMNITFVLEVIYFAGMSHNIMFQSNFWWIASVDVTEHIFNCSLSLKNKHLCTLRPLYGRCRLQ